MKNGGFDIALAVFRLRPAGGLERHALRLADELARRGHAVTIYTTVAGDLPEGVSATVLPRRGVTNHGRLRAFEADLGKAAAGRHDAVVGFPKMGGLDALFCCDWCFADRDASPLARLLPRHRAMLAMEEACCGPASRAMLLMLAEPQAQAYRKAYAIPPERLTVLPPTLDHARRYDRPAAAQRAAWRDELGIGAHRTAWLWVGLQPQVKGLDRAIRALALAPDAMLFACGADPARGQTRAAARLARTLGCADRLVFTGAVPDAKLKRLFLSADLLMHPARLDVTGTVIVEALGAGLPVIVTDNCGYAPHVSAAKAGAVVPRDASPLDMAQAASADVATRQAWSAPRGPMSMRSISPAALRRQPTSSPGSQPRRHHRAVRRLRRGRA